MRAPTILLLLLLTLGACQGGRGDSSICLCGLSDGGFGRDASEGCNLLSQVGCAAGEKCAQLVENEDPFLSRTTCVPDGTVGRGDACLVGPAGAATGYDDCSEGLDCQDGVCVKFCQTGLPDSCRGVDEAFGTGFYCIHARDFYEAYIGVCLPACDPNRDAVVDGKVVYTDCAVGAGCYPDGDFGRTTCQEVPLAAALVTQNQDCIGPASGGCSQNGCASGFAPLLPNKTVNADGSVCARFCSPISTHATAQSAVGGVNGKCSSAALLDVGGTNGVASEHQCRFVQSLYETPAEVSQELGICVPVTSASGGSFGDCRLLDWDGIKAAWAAAPSRGQEYQEALDNFCLVDPSYPPNSVVKNSCRGLYRGCLSLQEIETGLAIP